MQTYCVRRIRDDCFEHASPKGQPRQHHKYIARIDFGGKMRYFYTQAEIDAYKKAKTAGSTPDRISTRRPDMNTAGGQGLLSTLKRNFAKNPEPTSSKKTSKPEEKLEEATTSWAERNKKSKKSGSKGGSGGRSGGGGGKGSSGGGRGRGGSSKGKSGESGSGKKSKKKVSAGSVLSMKKSGKTIAEIAKALGISKSKVKALLKKAKSKVSLKKKTINAITVQKTRTGAIRLIRLLGEQNENISRKKGRR